MLADAERPQFRRSAVRDHSPSIYAALLGARRYTCTGTKGRLRRGRCGACTVVVGEAVDGWCRYAHQCLRQLSAFGQQVGGYNWTVRTYHPSCRSASGVTGRPGGPLIANAASPWHPQSLLRCCIPSRVLRQP